MAKDSDIANRANFNNIQKLKGLFVSDISIWTFDDTLKSDKAKGKTFADDWCKSARKRGYIYVVQIAGFGTPTD